jgi:hypothetical protein
MSIRNFPAFIFPLLSFFIWAGACHLGAGEDATALWMEGKPAGAACLKQLEEYDLDFLSGHPPADAPTALSPRLGRGLESGDEEALAVGLRLAPLLKGGPAQGVLKGLADAMADHPQTFLRALQEDLDFARQKGQAAALKETLWDLFVGADFGYDQNLEGESRDLRRRKAMVQGLTDPSFQEARVFTLEILHEKIRELPDGL